MTDNVLARKDLPLTKGGGGGALANRVDCVPIFKNKLHFLRF